MAFRVELSDRAQADIAAIYEWLLSQQAGNAGAGATQSQLSSFRVLGTYTAKGLRGKTQHHKKIVNEVAEKIVRLRRILEQLEARQGGR